MILSVSRRTDIPACYPEWFMRRLHEGVVMSRNPMNPRQVSRIALSAETIDCIVFWTKNPAPLMPFLSEIEAMGYAYIFQITLNAYGRDAETALPPLNDRVDTVRRLAERIGKQRIIWRYDPILLSGAYTVDWHGEQFARLSRQLNGCVDRCVISFLDVYGKIRSRLQRSGFRECTEAEMHRLAAVISAAAKENDLRLQSCAERIDLTSYGIGHGACIDAAHISGVLGVPLDARRDENQRSACGCVASIDVGEYDTCRNGCVYCYANHGESVVTRRAAQHCPDSPLMTGCLTAEDRVTDRQIKSLRMRSQQTSLL